jgi:hypothetical protein
MTVTISLVLQSVVGVSGERPRSASEVNQYLTPDTPHPIITDFLKAVVLTFAGQSL